MDGRQVRALPQSPDYPMQCMLGIYEFEAPTPGGPGHRPAAGYPKEFEVDYVHGYRPARPR